MIAVGLVGGDGNGLVRSPDTPRTAAKGASVGLVVGGDNIIHTINLIDMVALTDTAALRNDDTLGRVDWSGEVGLQFGALHRAIAVDGIHLAVVVEEHAEVVDIAFHIDVFPRSAGIVGYEHLEALTVDIGEDVKLAVMKPYAGGPDALTIYLTAVLQGESRVGKVETVEAVAPLFPVDEVAGVEDIYAGNGVHGGTGEIVVVADTQDIGVGKFIIEKRIGKGAVAVVGGPRTRLGYGGGPDCQTDDGRGDKSV